MEAEPDGAPMSFRTRKWVRPENLNANGTLFGGELLRWIDEEAAIYAILQLGNGKVVTKYISEINFVSSAQQGDLVEMGLRATHFGRTSLTMRAEVRPKAVASSPISTMSPSRAEETKSISEMYLVTTCRLPSWITAYTTASSSIQRSRLPPNSVPWALRSSGRTHLRVKKFMPVAVITPA